jgi:hypothetical protein
MVMNEDFRKFMKEVDGIAARLNAGLGAVALALSVAFCATLTIKLGSLAALSTKMLLGP